MARVGQLPNPWHSMEVVAFHIAKHLCMLFTMRGTL